MRNCNVFCAKFPLTKQVCLEIRIIKELLVLKKLLVDPTTFVYKLYLCYSIFISSKISRSPNTRNSINDTKLAADRTKTLQFWSAPEEAL